MKNKFDGKVVVVTGGSGGIGKSTAMKFAAMGAKVAIIYNRNEAGAKAVLEQICQKSMGMVVKADLASEKNARKAVKQIIDKLGKVDILVNNAGGYIDGDEWYGPSDIFIRTLERNLVSMMNISKYIIPFFLDQKKGIMVNVA